MKILKEFKEFAMRGNIVDLAVAVVVGGAFSKIVSSLVADVIMPPIGLLLGGIKFTDIKINMNEAVSVNIGNFIQAVVDFTIIAFAIFMVIKIMNRLQEKIKKEDKESVEAVEPKKSAEEVLLIEIRDILKERN